MWSVNRTNVFRRFALPRSYDERSMTTKFFPCILALLASAVCSAAQAGKIRVLLDTDCFNEIDDQFFVTYSLFEPSFEIEGITAAQYRWERGSVDESYYEILRVIDLITKSALSPMPYCRRAVPNDTPLPERLTCSSINPEPLSVVTIVKVWAPWPGIAARVTVPVPSELGNTCPCRLR